MLHATSCGTLPSSTASRGFPGAPGPRSGPETRPVMEAARHIGAKQQRRHAEYGPRFHPSRHEISQKAREPATSAAEGKGALCSPTQDLRRCACRRGQSCRGDREVRHETEHPRNLEPPDQEIECQTVVIGIDHAITDPSGRTRNLSTVDGTLCHQKQINAGNSTPRCNALTYGTPGPGTNAHLGMLRVQRHAGIAITHVPHSGAMTIIPAVLGGHIMLQVSGMEWKSASCCRTDAPPHDVDGDTASELSQRSNTPGARLSIRHRGADGDRWPEEHGRDSCHRVAQRLQESA